MGKGADGADDRARGAARTNPLLEPGTVASSWPKPGEPWIQGKDYTDETDFTWMLDEEPHRTRRMAILKKHPEIK